MSTNDDRGQEDTADLKDIDKILKKLVESLEKLNEHVGKMGKAAKSAGDAVAEHSEQTKRNRLEVQQSYFDNLKEMALFRKSLKESGGQFNFLTGLIKNGTSAVSVIGAVTRKLDGMGSSYDEYKQSLKENSPIN